VIKIFENKLRTLNVALSIGFFVSAVLLSVNVAVAEDAIPDQQIDQNDFQTAPLPDQGNEDSVSVPGLAMGTPTYSGSGCPNGSVSSALSPDQRTLSVLFDAYTARVGGGTKQNIARSNCSLQIPFIVPFGYRMQVVQMDYRGFAALDSKSMAMVSAAASLRRNDGRVFPGHKEFRRGAVLQGPMQKDFILTSRLVGPPWSPCGQSFVVVANSELGIRTGSLAESVASIDSLDAVALPVKLNLRWQKCSDTHGGRPGPNIDFAHNLGHDQGAHGRSSGGSRGGGR
jgi:hypothetical protein